jgi:hypothetical protein
MEIIVPIVILIIIGVLMTGCSQGYGQPSGTSDDAVKDAALKIVWPLPDCSESWIGGTVEQCDRAQARLLERRAEFATFEPTWMRKAIMEWLDFAEGQIAEAREDCVTQKSRRDLDDYRARTKAENERAQQVLRSIGR